MYFEEQTVDVETNSTERKGQCATAWDPVAVQRLHGSCVSDTVVSVAALLLESPDADQSAACSLPWYDVVDLIFGSSPSLKYFGDSLPHAFRGQWGQNYQKQTFSMPNLRHHKNFQFFFF